MGMFDEIRPINISHKNFDKEGNGSDFQTKSLDSSLSKYFVFNNTLYQDEKENGEAKKYNYNGKLNIYKIVEENHIEKWIEYDLIFKEGKLIDLIPHEIQIIKDKRKVSISKPNSPSNIVEVKISINDCDYEKQDSFMQKINDKMINAIKNAIDEKNALIIYPQKINKEMNSYVKFPRFINVYSKFHD